MGNAIPAPRASPVASLPSKLLSWCRNCHVWAQCWTLHVSEHCFYELDWIANAFEHPPFTIDLIVLLSPPCLDLSSRLKTAPTQHQRPLCHLLFGSEKQHFCRAIFPSCSDGPWHEYSSSVIKGFQGFHKPIQKHFVRCPEWEMSKIQLHPLIYNWGKGTKEKVTAGLDSYH